MKYLANSRADVPATPSNKTSDNFEERFRKASQPDLFPETLPPPLPWWGIPLVMVGAGIVLWLLYFV